MTILMRFFSAIIVVSIIFGVVYFSKKALYEKEVDGVKADLISQLKDDKIINENQEGTVLGETNQKSGTETTSSSENFKVKQLSFGGDFIVANSGDEKKLQIYDVRSESFILGKKEESKITVSWKTNKLALSSVEYSKKSGQNPKTVTEDSYGFNHAVSLSNIEQGNAYVFIIKAKDRWGNAIDSSYFGIYSASKPVSVFDLISEAMKETFGWTMAK